jgi:toxin ParE1/3/4
VRILWTEEALEDLAEIVVYYCYANASSSTAESVERRIIEHVEALPPFP